MVQSSIGDSARCNYRRSIGLTSEELQRMDIAYEGASSNLDEEKIPVENGDFVGQTAVIRDNRLTSTGGNLPAG